MKNKITLGLVSALALVVSGCGQAPTANTTQTSTIAAYESNTPSSDRTATWTGTIESEGPVTMKISISDNGLSGTYTLGATKKTSEVDGMIDAENNNVIAFSDFNETTDQPNIRHFELYEKGVRHYEGEMTKKGDTKKYTISLDEIDNDLAPQKAFGGHYLRSNTGYIDVLFLNDTDVKIQGLAASPHLADNTDESPNIWPLGRRGTFAKDDRGGIVRFDDEKCSLVLDFENNTITVAGPMEDESPACGAGSSTTFNGIFKRTSTPIKNWDIFESNS